MAASTKNPTSTDAPSKDQENLESVPLDFDSRLAEARAIVRSNVKWAAGISIVPVPIVDLVGVSAFQVRMLRSLSKLYEIPFMEHKVKNILSSLLVGAGTVTMGVTAAVGLAKFLPVIGPGLGLTVMPVIAGALTHATGQVFIGHFESGGNFLDFDPKKAREHFRAEFEAAEKELKSKAKKA